MTPPPSMRATHARRSTCSDLSPYVPGKPIDELAREYGLAEDDIVKLASNENPRGPEPAACARRSPTPPRA